MLQYNVFYNKLLYLSSWDLFSMENKGKGFDFMFCSKDNKHSYFIPNEIRSWATTAL